MKKHRTVLVLPSAGASAIGTVYAEQSLHALVSVNDQIENAVERAIRRWRQGILSDFRSMPAMLQAAFETVWGLLSWAEGQESKIDDSLASKLNDSLKYCAPAASEQLAERLKADDNQLNFAWALNYLGDSRGFAALSSHYSDDRSLMTAALSFGIKAESEPS